MTRYEEFVNMLSNMIYTLSDMESEDVRFHQDAEDDRKDRLMLTFMKKNDFHQVCALHTRDLYDQFCEGITLKEMVIPTLESIQRMQKSTIIDKIMRVEEYEVIREDLFVRIMNYDQNLAELDGVVYRKIGDIAMVLYLLIEEADGILTSTKIQEYMLERWTESREQIFNQALVNTYLLSPPRLFHFDALLADPHCHGINFMNLCEDLDLTEEPVGFCLTTQRKADGAISVFLPGVADRLCHLLGSGFYISFTSVHESMIHVDTSIDPDFLRFILKDTIQEATSKDDYLTCQLFHYDKETRQFEIV